MELLIDTDSSFKFARVVYIVSVLSKLILWKMALFELGFVVQVCKEILWK